MTVTSHPSSAVTTCLSPGVVRARIHELLGGFRLSAPNRSWVTPYSVFAVGAVRASASAAAAGVSPVNIEGTGLNDSAGTTKKFAVGAGGGLEFKITRSFGMDLDIRAVKAMDLRWYFRPTVGAYVRFH